MTSYNKKKLNIGNSKVTEKINICRSFVRIFDKLLLGTKPPEDIDVKAKLTASRSLRSIKVYKNITKIVVKK